MHNSLLLRHSEAFGKPHLMKYLPPIDPSEQRQLLASSHVRTLPSRYGRPPSGPVDTKTQRVYLMKTPSGFAKVGIAKNPDARRAELQTGNPEVISIVGATSVSESGVCPKEMERRIHVLLREYHSCGEWFNAPDWALYAAWKYAWTSLVNPAVAIRYERLAARNPAPEMQQVDTTELRAIAARIRRQTTNPDIIELCDAALAVHGDCPVCVARRAARSVSQRKWRAKKGAT